MSFLNPTYLWALLGLLIPIAIHLWSNKEGKTIKIGSTKLLSEEYSKQSSSINLNELLLLAFRLLIITLVVLVMAEPQFKKTAKNTNLTYIVEPSLLKNEKIVHLVDSLKNFFPVLVLQNQFPVIEDFQLEKTNFNKTPDYWQLAKNMEALKTDSIIIFTNAFLKGLHGKRPTINKPIDWVIFDIEPTKEDIVKVVLKGDSIQLFSVIGKSDNLSFNTKMLSKNSSKIKLNTTKDSIFLNYKNTEIKQPLLAEKKLNLLLYSSKKYKTEAIYLETVLNTISNYLNTPINIEKSEDSLIEDFSNYDKIIWLGNHKYFNTKKDILLYKIDDLASNILEMGNTKNTTLITDKLNPESIINKQFTEQFISWLGIHSDIEHDIKALDGRIVSKTELSPTFKIGNTTNNLYTETKSLVKWLALLLISLLIFERVISFFRKQ